MLKQFFKGMFSEKADVDSVPMESQPLAKRTADGPTATDHGSSQCEGRAISLEESQNQPKSGYVEEENAGDDTSNSPGLTDGYQAWTQSFEAFHSAIFHTVVYFTVGVLAYSFFLKTRWPIVDSLYFSVVIFTTVGYGDLTPGSEQGEIFTMFFAIYGIIIIGIFLGVMGDMFIESTQKRRNDNIADVRQKYLQTFQHGTYQHGNHPPLVFTSEEALIERESKDSCTDGFQTYFLICKDNLLSIATLISIAIPIIVIEDWGIVKGLYWMVITGTTIGLGDETPTHAISKALCVLYIPLAVYTVGRLLGSIASSFLNARGRKAEEKFLNRALKLSDLDRMDFDSNGVVSEEEFLIYMLITLQKVEEDDINEIIQVFRKLDKTGDGALTAEDLRAGIRKITNELTAPLRSGYSPQR